MIRARPALSIVVLLCCVYIAQLILTAPVRIPTTNSTRRIKMNKPVIISGEASETDSEDETHTHGQIIPPVMTTSIQGAVITGEDSESETENDASISSAISALQESCSVETLVEADKYDSLLHQKLRESNGKLHNDVESFWTNLTGEASRNLNSIDQQLIRSQLTLQNAVTSLKSLSTNSLALKNKLQSLLTSQFISNIKVDNDK